MSDIMSAWDGTTVQDVATGGAMPPLVHTAMPPTQMNADGGKVTACVCGAASRSLERAGPCIAQAAADRPCIEHQRRSGQNASLVPRGASVSSNEMASAVIIVAGQCNRGRPCTWITSPLWREGAAMRTAILSPHARTATWGKVCPDAVNGAALPHGCRPRYDGTDYMRHYDHGDP